MHTAISFAFLAAAVPAAVAPPLGVGLEPGPHAVGFRVELVRDEARPHSGAPRPVQVGCWYPAVAPGGAPMTYGDYLAHSGTERGEAGADRAATLAEYRGLLTRNGVPAAAVDEWLALPVRARAAAPARPGPWPLVLVAQGYFHSLHHQALLAEHLASRGAVVCSTPSPARLVGPMASEADVFPYAAAQAADLALAAAFARRERGAAGEPELVGHSFGARSALLFAARHGARALVSLDGGIGAAEARDWIREAPEIDPARLRLPILHVYEEGDPALTPDFRLLESLIHAPRGLLQVDGLRHVHFTSYGCAAAALPALEPEPRAELPARVAAVAAATADFLEAARAGRARLGQPAPGLQPRWWPAK